MSGRLLQHRAEQKKQQQPQQWQQLQQHAASKLVSRPKAAAASGGTAGLQCAGAAAKLAIVRCASWRLATQGMKSTRDLWVFRSRSEGQSGLRLRDKLLASGDRSRLALRLLHSTIFGNLVRKSVERKQNISPTCRRFSSEAGPAYLLRDADLSDMMAIMFLHRQGTYIPRAQICKYSSICSSVGNALLVHSNLQTVELW